ncbi:MBL fold metallo-hydrolase [Nocardia blacklockiae]|uniref:MBL fold metallo-hydrolase n=1 Tax=Nocardia blacklockiae TaxID=480036 RepID=UPI001892F4FE|nr:MBL fold metallo-hydrolase [Nocardia blacklockiae]MBF6170127.1 MBL fold metallo-hydrolase [Nocardia blacklockiae]
MTRIQADERLSRPGRIRSIRLGETTVSFVPDGAVQGKPREWLPDSTAQTWAEQPQYLDAAGYLVASIGGLLVEHAGRALLIDAGFGPQSMPAEPGGPNGAIYGGALLDSLAELGRGPGEIEAVAFTHLHPDHIGWAWHPADGGDQPVFTEAEYLVPEPEWTHRELLEAGGTTAEIAAVLAPRVRTVTAGHEIFPGVEVQIVDGHTSGHARYVITGGGTRLIAFGDSLHSPIQVDHPEWSCVYDHDPLRAAEQRRRLLAELEQPGTIGFGNHFADVVFGRVRRTGHGPGWLPLDEDEFSAR